MVRKPDINYRNANVGFMNFGILDSFYMRSHERVGLISRSELHHAKQEIICPVGIGNFECRG